MGEFQVLLAQLLDDFMREFSLNWVNETDGADNEDGLAQSLLGRRRQGL